MLHLKGSCNFIQLLNLWAIDTPGLGDWMKKKTNKYTSHDIQNEVLHIMALNWYFMRCHQKHLLQWFFFSILADECTDASNKEQLVVCIRWVDELLQDHENVIGVYNVGTIDAKTLTDALEDVFVWAGLKIHNCRGQCYDHLSCMTTGLSRFLYKFSVLMTSNAAEPEREQYGTRISDGLDCL